MNQHMTKSALASTDRDALAFLEAAQIYNTNQQRAIVNLVRSLKRVGLWSKMKAIYPFVGGTASSHKWNLKDPRDVDAAFRLSFLGGWTHASTGALPNGSNGYADTFLIPNNTLTVNSTHVSFYSKTNQAGSTVHEAGVDTTGALASSFQLILKYSDSNAYLTSGSSTALIIVNNNNSLGYYVGTRTSSTLLKLYRNNSTLATDTRTSTTTNLPTTSIVLSAYKQNTALALAGYSNKEIAFASFGDGLTDTDASNLYNIVDLYQRRLGRNV